MSRDLAATTLTLCAIPSVTGAEGAICDHVAGWARESLSGCVVRRIGNALLVLPEPRDGRPCVGLFGHFDTVLPATDQPLEVRDGRVYGCGASDMKGGLAVMMAMLERRRDYHADLAVIFYDREEGPVDESGLPAVLTELPPLDLAVMLEPTANRLQLGCVGGLHARIRFQGRRAHSARPWQGDNALYRALPLLARLQARPRREVIIDGLPFYEVMTPTTAVTRNSRNVVPDVFEVNVNFRFSPGRALDDAEAELREVLGSEGEVEIIDRAPAGAVCRSHPLVERWIERAGLDCESKQAWTDVARLTAMGVAAVNMGPGDPAQAHQAGEHVDVAALDEGLRVLEALVLP